MKPTTMLYRNLMAMDVEESIRSYPLDGVVLLTGCDKTNPASIMGAASADIPSIVVTGGPMLNGRWRGREIGSCSDCWHYHEELRAGASPRRSGRDRELDVPLERALHDDGHGLDDGLRHRGARPHAPGRRGDPSGRLGATQLAEQAGPADRGARGRGPEACPTSSPRGVRERDPRAPRDLRLDERDPPPDGVRGPRRRRASAPAVRRALRVDAVARRPQACRPLPDGGLLLRGRCPGRHGADRRPPPLDAVTVSGRPSRRTSPARRS